ncbi:hypothetical protein BGZ74_011258 [Mortierella antarctica]|nr:hypothetical protein BGZ74_011258 [Mortierella antarctica]
MKHPPSPLYQHSFLKKLIAMIENEGIHELSDDLLELFTDLMMTVPKRPEAGGPPLRPCFKSYCLDRNCDKVVTVMEEQTTISSGTTGLRTWEASFWLAEYLIAHPDLLSGKNVIDIGCGVGFLGISCAMLGAKKVVLTDGNTDVLTMAKENIGYMTILKAILVKGVSAYMSSAIRNPQTFVDFFARIKEECQGVEIQEIPLDSVKHLFFFDEDTVQTVKVFHLFFP